MRGVGEADLKLETETLRVKENGSSRGLSLHLGGFHQLAEGGLLSVSLVSCTARFPRGLRVYSALRSSLLDKCSQPCPPGSPARSADGAPGRAPAAPCELFSRELCRLCPQLEEGGTALLSLLGSRRLFLSLLTQSPHPENQACLFQKAGGTCLQVAWYLPCHPCSPGRNVSPGQ